jgi:hypothetical protein
MAGTGVLDLYTSTEELFDAAVSALDEIPTFAPGLGGAPERSFIGHGTPTIPRCDQLVVSAIPVREAPTQPLELGAGTRHQQDFRKNYVGWKIWITRCGDLSDVPQPTTEAQAVAQQVYADGWALWNYLWNMARAGTLFSLCGGVYFDSLDPLTPSGGVWGNVLSIRAELEGFEGTP